MIEDIEGLKSVADDARNAEIREIELDFIGECITPPRVDELIARIDDIQGSKPPKAIDSNPEIAKMLEPIRDQIPTKYLEAPDDMEQVRLISEIMSATPELKPEVWKELSLQKRIDVLNKLENQIAQIEHRNPCPIVVEDLGKITKTPHGLLGSMGVHSTNGFGKEEITINSRLIMSDDPEFFEEALNTLIHEGRHSYQTYNLTHRSVHTSAGDLTNWYRNLNEFGYQRSKFGYKLYWMQPIEADARKFAEDVLTAYKKKI